MKLTHATVLEGIAAALGDQVGPRVDDGFTLEALRMAQSLIRIVALASEDAVAIQVEENATMRRFFAEAVEMIGPGELADRLNEAGRSHDPGLRLSELQAETGRLRVLLVELQTWLEDHPRAASHALAEEIWQALRTFELARAPKA
jgi:hypothetical protein